MRPCDKILRQKNRVMLLALVSLSLAFYLLFLTEAGVL
jgi:hypothetical protein